MEWSLNGSKKQILVKANANEMKWQQFVILFNHVPWSFEVSEFTIVSFVCIEMPDFYFYFVELQVHRKQATNLSIIAIQSIWRMITEMVAVNEHVNEQ